MTKPTLKPVPAPRRPSREAAMEAVRTLLAWAGDDPDREGLRDTPKRVINAYQEWFAGYEQDAGEHLSKTFADMSGYDDMVVLKDIDVNSHCEHHIAPFIGKCWLAYLPTDSVVGISKLVKVVDMFSRRLQSQEALSAQIAEAIEEHLKPRGVAVMIDAAHECMTTRGVAHKDVTTLTTHFTGEFRSNPALQDRFLRTAGK